jgi:MFS family permease
MSTLRDSARPTRTPGSAAAALSNPNFRRLWLGSFASNVGTWMQSVVLGSFVYKLTESTGHPSTYVGLVFLASLGPILLFGMAGGFLADRLRRGPWIMALQAEQGIFSLVLAAIIHFNSKPSVWPLFACVFAIGIGNALNGPAWGAVVPSVVGAQDLPGALSLNSTMINGSRVIGPAIAGLLYPILGAAAIFVMNAVTYAFVIVAFATVRLPIQDRPTGTRSERFMGGITYAKAHPRVRRCLIIMTLLSVLSLSFVGLFPSIAERSLRLGTKSATYGWLYATFGMGAMLGSLAIGTVLVRTDKRLVARRGLFALGLMILAFGWTTSVTLAFPIVFILGACYFGTTTALMTVLQAGLIDSVRGRIMALWMMAFGGTVAISLPFYGWLFDRLGGRWVLSLGAASAVGIGWWAKLGGSGADTKAKGPDHDGPALLTP